MMVLLKVARTKMGPHSDDHFVDGAGYMAIAGEIYDDNRDRYSMSFNTFVKGSMGDENELDLLEL